MNAGHFLLHSLLDELGVRETIDILASQMRFQFSIYEMLALLIYARVLYPCSKSKTVSLVFPHLYGSTAISEDQVYDGCAFVGGSCKKYIELFNRCYEQHYKRDFSSVFFDCTNYYFEIDLPDGDRQKGPSRENRNDPIIGQALLLDADLVPLAMQMYPWNESEKPYLRKTFEDMKHIFLRETAPGERPKKSCRIVSKNPSGISQHPKRIFHHYHIDLYRMTFLPCFPSS